MDTKKSELAFQRAKNVIVGGVNSPVRAFGGVGLCPLFIAKANGAIIEDIDGNQFIDYVGSWGPMILGHCHPYVIQAIQQAAQRGTSYGAPTEAETLLAEKIICAFKSIELVRMVSSGTEAAMTAIRLARAYTKRPIIIKMAGCYHGHSDSVLVAAGSGLAEQSIPASEGVPAVLAQQTLVVEYNDIPAVCAAFKKYADRIAAVIVEPVAANMGVVQPKQDYLAQLRQICDQYHAVLIFDEIITGFRIAYGGAQEYYNIQADLTCLGKIIGGGLPAAAVGGKRQIMELLAPVGKVYQAGTLSGNPLAMAAANATLDLLTEPHFYKKLDEKTRCLTNGILSAAKRFGIPVCIHQVGSMFSVFFTEKTVWNFSDVQTSDVARFKRVFAGLLKQGIYVAPSAFEAWFVSASHTDQQIEKTINAIYNVFEKESRYTS